MSNKPREARTPCNQTELCYALEPRLRFIDVRLVNSSDSGLCALCVGEDGLNVGEELTTSKGQRYEICWVNSPFRACHLIGMKLKAA